MRLLRISNSQRHNNIRFHTIADKYSKTSIEQQPIKPPAIKVPKQLQNKYLLITEFEARTVSYGPSFSRSDLWPKREARAGQKHERKKRGSVTCSKDRENTLIDWLIDWLIDRMTTKVMNEALSKLNKPSERRKWKILLFKDNALCPPPPCNIMLVPGEPLLSGQSPLRLPGGWPSQWRFLCSRNLYLILYVLRYVSLNELLLCNWLYYLNIGVYSSNSGHPKVNWVVHQSLVGDWTGFCQTIANLM